MLFTNKSSGLIKKDINGNVILTRRCSITNKPYEVNLKQEIYKKIKSTNEIIDNISKNDYIFIKSWLTPHEFNQLKSINQNGKTKKKKN